MGDKAEPTAEEQAGSAAGYPEYQLFKSLIFKVNLLSSLYFKSSSRYYQRQFGMGVPEVRLLNIIGGMPPAGAQEVVTLSSMDKGLVSRSLVNLIKRDYLIRIPDPNDRRRFTLKLTAAGQRLYQRIVTAKRNRHLRAVSGMTPEECRELYRLLDKAIATASAMAATDGAPDEGQDDHERYHHSWPPTGLLDIASELTASGAPSDLDQVSR